MIVGTYRTVKSDSLKRYFYPVFSGPIIDALGVSILLLFCRDIGLSKRLPGVPMTKESYNSKSLKTRQFPKYWGVATPRLPKY